MTTEYSDGRTGRLRTNILRHLFVAAASCAMVGSSVIGCASTPTTYNPGNLDQVQFARVSDVCQNVMGLNPDERLSGGNWLGDDRLDYWTSYYRGCVLSLSDSLQSAADEHVTSRADADCRAQGYQPDSPDLALCVLQSVNSRPNPMAAETQTAGATPVSNKAPPAPGPFVYASPRETVRRERVACAALGFEPSRGVFESCVKGLGTTFYAIDHPEN